MSSKMREALEEAWERGREYGRNGIVWEGKHWTDIAQRYGDLAFTREEVRKICKALLQEPIHAPMGHDWRIDSAIDRVISRHTEAGGETKTVEAKIGKRYTREPFSIDEPDSELIALTKRVAAIEKRVLADGHSKKCDMRWGGGYDCCTCHHDEIRENAK